MFAGEGAFFGVKSLDGGEEGQVHRCSNGLK